MKLLRLGGAGEVARTAIFLDVENLLYPFRSEGRLECGLLEIGALLDEVRETRDLVLVETVCHYHLYQEAGIPSIGWASGFSATWEGETLRTSNSAEGWPTTSLLPAERSSSGVATVISLRRCGYFKPPGLLSMLSPLRDICQRIWRRRLTR